MNLSPEITKVKENIQNLKDSVFQGLRLKYNIISTLIASKNNTFIEKISERSLALKRIALFTVLSFALSTVTPSLSTFKYPNTIPARNNTVQLPEKQKRSEIKTEFSKVAIFDFLEVPKSYDGPDYSTEIERSSDIVHFKLNDFLEAFNNNDQEFFTEIGSIMMMHDGGSHFKAKIDGSNSLADLYKLTESEKKFDSFEVLDIREIARYRFTLKSCIPLEENSNSTSTTEIIYCTTVLEQSIDYPKLDQIIKSNKLDTVILHAPPSKVELTFQVHVPKDTRFMQKYKNDKNFNLLTEIKSAIALPNIIDVNSGSIFERYDGIESVLQLADFIKSKEGVNFFIPFGNSGNILKQSEDSRKIVDTFSRLSNVHFAYPITSDLDGKFYINFSGYSDFLKLATPIFVPAENFSSTYATATLARITMVGEIKGFKHFRINNQLSLISQTEGYSFTIPSGDYLVQTTNAYNDSVTNVSVALKELND
jgi:hypothetical protein